MMERFWIHLHYLRIKQMIKAGCLFEEYSKKWQKNPAHDKTFEAAMYKLSIAITQLKIAVLQEILKLQRND